MDQPPGRNLSQDKTKCAKSLQQTHSEQSRTDSVSLSRFRLVACGLRGDTSDGQILVGRPWAVTLSPPRGMFVPCSTANRQALPRIRSFPG